MRESRSPDRIRSETATSPAKGRGDILNIWTSGGRPNPISTDPNDGPVDLASIIAAQEDMYVHAFRLFNHSGAQAVGGRTARIWDYDSQTLITSLAIDNPTWSGWKEFYLPSPITVQKATSIIDTSHWIVVSATYDGYTYSNDLNGVPGASYVQGSDGGARILSDHYISAANPGAGRFTYSVGSFPSNKSNFSSYYGVDILYQTI